MLFPFSFAITADPPLPSLSSSVACTAGESTEEVQPLAQRLRANGIGSILAYSVESDVDAGQAFNDHAAEVFMASRHLQMFPSSTHLLIGFLSFMHLRSGSMFCMHLLSTSSTMYQ